MILPWRAEEEDIALNNPYSTGLCLWGYDWGCLSNESAPIPTNSGPTMPMLRCLVGQQEVTAPLAESTWLSGKDNSPVSDAVCEMFQCKMQIPSNQEWLSLISST
ncbi:caspase-2 [Limosa lapponica baueri]|uniref:Caspase-2 n=1 Tax=Limosa lapponica baueri TaxID=1758121 RepID=A0A2I0UEA4_LIMLA|nr:caspase-2 [Limosa lapponica baueri]